MMNPKYENAYLHSLSTAQHCNNPQNKTPYNLKKLNYDVHDQQNKSRLCYTDSYCYLFRSFQGNPNHQ